MGALALRIVNAFRAAIRRIELMQCQAIGQPRSLLEGADQVMTTAGAAEYPDFPLELCKRGASSERVPRTAAHRAASVT